MKTLVWAKNTKTGNIGYGAKEVTLTNGLKAVMCTPIGTTNQATWKNYVMLEDGRI